MMNCRICVTDFKKGDRFAPHPRAAPKKPILNRVNVLTFIQMRTDENKFWQIKNTSGNGCVQVRKDFDK